MIQKLRLSSTSLSNGHKCKIACYNPAIIASKDASLGKYARTSIKQEIF